jgi:hypothetical protein
VRRFAVLVALAMLLGGWTHGRLGSGWTGLSPTLGTGSCSTSGSTYTGSCIVYVADAANGGTVGASCVAAPPLNNSFPTPCLDDTQAHIGAAYAYLRNNSSDWMVFAACSVTNASIGNTSGFASGLNGASPSAPIVFTMYGSTSCGTACHDARPCFKTGANYCFEAFNSNYGQNLALVSLECYDSAQDPASADYTAPIAAGTPGATCGNSGTSCVYTGTTIPASLTAAGAMAVYDLTQNIALPGHISTASGTTITMSSALTTTINSGDTLAFWSNAPQGIYVVGTTYILIEDCRVSFYGTNIALENITSNNTNPYSIHVRRNELLDAYGFTTHGIGLFVADNANGGTIEVYQNVIDHNGWNNGAAFNWVNQVVGAGATIFSHDIYIHDINPPATIIGNILSNASATGAQARSGGTVYNNLCVGDPICLQIYTGFQTNANATSYNVITDATDIQYGSMITSGPSTSTTLNFTAVLPVGIAANAGLYVIDLTNPAAIPTSTTDTVASAGATSVTISHAATAVASGDQILFFSPRGQGISYNYCGGYGLSVAATSGATTLKFASLGPGVATGQSVLAGSGIAAATTISSITVVTPGVETDVVINNPITANIATYANGGPPIQFYTSPVSSPADLFCSSTTGPNNVYSRQNQFNAINSQALYFPAGTYYFNYGGDYFIGSSTFAGYPNAGFNWGIQGAGTQYVDQGTNNNSTGEHANYTPSGTPTIEAYDTSIGGPGTAADFIAGARALSKAAWNPAYTAPSANNWIRSQVSSGIPAQPLN